MTVMRRRTADERHHALTSKVELYCAERHSLDGGQLCEECLDLLAYARKRMERCPHDPKPRCKNCRTHCYGPGYRDKVRAVMRFAAAHHAWDGGRGDRQAVPALDKRFRQAVSHG